MEGLAVLARLVGRSRLIELSTEISAHLPRASLRPGPGLLLWLYRPLPVNAIDDVEDLVGRGKFEADGKLSWKKEEEVPTVRRNRIPKRRLTLWQVVSPKLRP